MRMMCPASSSENKVEKKLIVLEEHRCLQFSYQDIMNYHGGAMPAGVALACQLFCYLFDRFGELYDRPPRRGEASFYTGLGENGQGIIDTADILLRIRKHNALRYDPADCASVAAPDAPGGGKYYFYGTLGRMHWSAVLKDGLLEEGYLAASRTMHEKQRQGAFISDQEKSDLLTYRQKTEEAILSLTPEQLFHFTIEDTQGDIQA